MVPYPPPKSVTYYLNGHLKVVCVITDHKCLKQSLYEDKFFQSGFTGKKISLSRKFLLVEEDMTSNDVAFEIETELNQIKE